MTIRDVFEKLTLDVVLDGAKSFILHQATRWAGAILLSLGLGWCGHEAKVAPEIKTATEENKRLTQQIQLSKVTTTVDPQLIEDAVERAMRKMPPQFDKREYQRQVDSMKAESKRIIESAVTAALLRIGGSGKIVKSHFEDDFITMDVDSVENLKWVLEAVLGEIRTKFSDSEGKRSEITSYWLKSKKNPRNSILFDSVVSEVVAEAEQQIDLSKMWVDSRVSLDVVPGDGLLAGLSYTPFMITSGGDDEDAVILRYPEVSWTSDYKERFVVSLGAKINTAHWIPVLENLYVSPRVGVELVTRRVMLTLAIGVNL